MPRPVRKWNGEEYALKDLILFEKDYIVLDDIIMMRYLILYIVSEEARKVIIEVKCNKLLLEPDRTHNPNAVTLYRAECTETSAEMKILVFSLWK